MYQVSQNLSHWGRNLKNASLVIGELKIPNDLGV